MSISQLQFKDAPEHISSRIHESVFKGEAVHFESPLFKRWVQSGNPAVFPDSVKIVFDDTEFSDPSIEAEAKLITKACFFPFHVSDGATDPSDIFVCTIPAGTFFPSIHRFALVMLKEMKRMLDSGISDLIISNRIRITHRKAERRMPECSSPTPDEIRNEIRFIEPEEGRGESYLAVQKEVQSVLSYFEKNIFVFNTEKLALQDFGFHPDHLIFPCAGLKPLAILRKQSEEGNIKKCTFLEKNPRAIDYYRTFLNCDNPSQVFELQYQTLKNQHFLPTEGQEFFQSLLKGALEEGFSGETVELMEQIVRMKNLASFYSLDYLNEHDRLISLLDPAEKALFWHSNAWESHYALFFRSQEDLRKNYLTFAGKLGDFYRQPVWIHKVAYEIVVGEDFHMPIAVCSAGGRKSGKPKLSSYLPLKDFNL